MSNNSQSWLEAYEAQKAKALEQIEASKNGTKNDKSVTGLSQYSGCVDTKEISRFSKQTQVTKLLGNLKNDQKPQKSAKELSKITSQESKTTKRTMEKVPESSEILGKRSKSDLKNQFHNVVKQQQMVSLKAFETRKQVEATKVKEVKPPKAPSVASLIEKVKKDAKSDSAKDWQAAYEERKKAALAALNKK
jgi:hypothetical protein